MTARAQEESGTTVVGEMGITETVAEIMERAARDDKPWDPADGIRLFEEFKPDPTIYPNPDAPDVAMWPPQKGVSPINYGALDQKPFGGGGPRLPQSVGTQFSGITFAQTPGYIPPDSTGAVGPTQVLVCANGRIRVYSKTGTLGGLNATTDSFFTSVRSGQTTSDPQVRYDPITSRWFVTIITTSTPNRILVAVSSGPTITNAASFTFFGFSQDADGQQVGAFADHEKTGVDANAIVMGCNMFSGASGGTVWVVKKSSVLSGGPLTFTSFRNLNAVQTPNGVDNDDPAATFSYVLGTSSTSGQLKFRRITNPGGVPTISSDINITVPATTQPLGQVALGTTGSLDAIDTRLAYVQAHKDRYSGVTRIVAAHNIKVNSSGTTGSPDRNAIRWYQLQNLTAGTPTLVQSGTLFDPAATKQGYWMGSAAMTGQGHIAIAASTASASTTPNIAVAGRLRADTLGTTQAPTAATTSTAQYNIQGSGTQRWGDYAMTAVDPNDDQTIWAFAEYCDTGNSWQVRCVQLKAPPPATPASCSPPSVAQGASNVNVVVTGALSSTNEFFDADASHPNHIAASVSGSGVTVNSATWSPSTPTQVTLNISVTGGAATGLRNITITNPDGQSATGNGILMIDTSSVCPSYTQQPSDDTKCQGQTASFTVAVAGSPTPTLQWYHGVNPVGGATLPTLTLNNVQPADGGTYFCRATNSCGSLDSNTVTLTVNVAPSITSNPSDQNVHATFQSASFHVAASGTPTLTYQWRRNGSNLTDGGAISGATTDTLTFNPADLADNGTSIDCVVTNGCGSTPSNAAAYNVYCPSDYDLNGFVNGDDFDSFVAAFEAGDPSADFDGNTFVNGDDFDLFVQYFEAGC